MPSPPPRAGFSSGGGTTTAILAFGAVGALCFLLGAAFGFAVLHAVCRAPSPSAAWNLDHDRSRLPAGQAAGLIHPMNRSEA